MRFEVQDATHVQHLPHILLQVKLPLPNERRVFAAKVLARWQLYSRNCGSVLPPQLLVKLSEIGVAFLELPSNPFCPKRAFHCVSHVEKDLVDYMSFGMDKGVGDFDFDAIFRCHLKLRYADIRKTDRNRSL